MVKFPNSISCPGISYSSIAPCGPTYIRFITKLIDPPEFKWSFC